LTITTFQDPLDPIRSFERPSGLARLLVFLYTQDTGLSNGIVNVFYDTNINPSAGYGAMR
jgi:hypothetical protein